jgi:formylmethanofuran dehydrogenase subunit E
MSEYTDRLEDFYRYDGEHIPLSPYVDPDSGITTCVRCGEDVQLTSHAAYTSPPICEDCAEGSR